VVLVSQVGEAYERDLRAYLENPSEEGLTAAYQGGRNALGGGIGLVAFAEMHSRAFAKIGHLNRDSVFVANLAASFFGEAMATYEMALRGYRDVNEALTNANERLTASNQELEAFSYSLAHDLRAPLRSMAGFAARLKEEATDLGSPESGGYADRIIASAQRMGLLIDHLLTLSRVHRQQLRKERVSPGAIAQRALDDLEDIVISNHARVEIGLMPDCDGDPNLLQQVYANLIANALKYSGNRPDPLVEVGSTNDEKKGTIYHVRDNGVGFDMRYRGKLFGVFQRLHSDTEFEGTGVGLAIVQRIVARHGGEVFAVGVVGEGATFSFTLPAADGILR
jgi:light-regulated signal transduction histidine kinase (bacteriophytochrome)